LVEGGDEEIRNYLQEHPAAVQRAAAIRLDYVLCNENSM
jgi:hypothetical protein